MFLAILATQWKWTRGVVLLATVSAFSLPLVAYSNARGTPNAISFVAAMQRWAPGYAIVAAALGLLVALAAWQPDHQGRHVYALSLPITRSRYVGLRGGAGGIFLLPPIVALLVGALIVALSGSIPEGLHAYPIALTLRFALAAALAYAIFFAVASSTPQTAGVIIGIIAAVFFTQYLLSTAGTRIDILVPTFNFLFDRPGILSVFSGRWMLVDV